MAVKGDGVIEYSVVVVVVVVMMMLTMVTVRVKPMSQWQAWRIARSIGGERCREGNSARGGMMRCVQCRWVVAGRACCFGVGLGRDGRHNRDGMAALYPRTVVRPWRGRDGSGQM
ncbi:hypothetical protein BU24DRAFT_38996 [Aaosphaeria arxii CBS 175.79]|uniref:Uncharacterized protein n=1 Tax=Aaosphaeria arxii CBS 175.79 TaxID=1450172 RepID=A0A6A5YBV2_9PLEO|nr:uncharacterized protein BU24DRAFT_38996 [Aaosphaeria arxii CBS 175.79]KAF2022160.1 hypothetical protein BU24DRAFT_38996 [Aaosphaeria arxii CBS 175.79]